MCSARRRLPCRPQRLEQRPAAHALAGPPRGFLGLGQPEKTSLASGRLATGVTTGYPGGALCPTEGRASARRERTPTRARGRQPRPAPPPPSSPPPTPPRRTHCVGPAAPRSPPLGRSAAGGDVAAAPAAPRTCRDPGRRPGSRAPGQRAPRGGGGERAWRRAACARQGRGGGRAGGRGEGRPPGSGGGGAGGGRASERILVARSAGWWCPGTGTP
jgi:hypothetical protein